jgi:hypothetical protein
MSKGREQGVEKWMVYQEIHRLKNLGFSNSKIARKLKISRNRVIEYLGMTPEEFAEFIASLQTRSKKLDPYQKLQRNFFFAILCTFILQNTV